MVLRIQQLYDYGNDRRVRFKDVDRDKFDDSYEVRYEGNTYVIYSYNPPKELVRGKYIKDRNLYRDGFDEAPITVFVNKGGDRVVDEGFIAHQLFEEYGEGRYQVWKQGGNPPQERYFKNKFIVKKDRGI